MAHSIRVFLLRGIAMSFLDSYNRADHIATTVGDDIQNQQETG